MKCLGCGRIVAQPRVRFERRVRGFVQRADSTTAGSDDPVQEE
jgi:DNA-directed RNA polymerase subunit N (RpoN/RPB10)